MMPAHKLHYISARNTVL